MGQKFYASPYDTFEFSNGAIGHRPGGPFDCPVEGYDKRLTCYATGYADTYFSIPACTRINGKPVRGYFTMDDGAISFRPYRKETP